MLGGNKGQVRVRCSCFICKPWKHKPRKKERFRHRETVVRTAAREQIEEARRGE